MGNEPSVELETAGTVLQQQDTEHLWKIVLNRGNDEEGTGVCVFTRKPGVGTQADLCETGVEHLRLLRHPNILKFIGCDVTDDCIVIVTEPIIPVFDVLENISIEGLVMGWRGVANGLAFLHSKAHLSHNNISMECVYVSTMDSIWKIGGFEAATKHKNVDANFLSSISSVRHEKATPPEDKAATPPKPGSVPYHARDIWAFGNFILATLEETTLDNRVSDSLFTYVQEEMLNSDPHHRPTANDVISQPWMSNRISEITDFLSKLTLKSQVEKDQFFGAVAGHLHSLPQADVAEHIVPLLITPLVMAEPLARKSLWKHLLHPISHTIPRSDKFDPNHICPLLNKAPFSAHVLPLLLNLLESRDLHVRTVLLEHLGSFAAIVPHEDLHSVVLPEVLVGLSDNRDEVIQFTLHALADLVPLLGSEAIIGDGLNRGALFTDSMPRGKVPPVTKVGIPDKMSTLTVLPKVDGRQRTAVSRKERMEQMKAKREEQRLKRNAQTKLGVTVGVESALVEDQDSNVLPSEAPFVGTAPQYSPSVSHDEEHWNDTEEGSGTSSMMSSKLGETPQRKPESAEEAEQWEEFEGESTPGVDDWNQLSESGMESWTQSWSDGQIQSSQNVSSGQKRGGTGGMKLKVSRQGRSDDQSSPSVKSRESHKPKKSYSTLGSKPAISETMKGRLSTKDIERLQEQLSWSTEPDFFADMAPSISNEKGLSGSEKTSEEQVIESNNMVEQPLHLSSAFQYQPSEEVGGSGWGEEEWEEF